MLLEIQEIDDFRILRVKEPRIDMSTSRDFKNKAIKNLASSNIKVLIINLNDVEYCDSSALGSLVSIYRETKSLQIELRICCLQRAIESLMKLAKLDSMLKFYINEQMALK